MYSLIKNPVPSASNTDSLNFKNMPGENIYTHNYRSNIYSHTISAHTNRSWIEINKDNLLHNLKIIQNQMTTLTSSKLIAVIKADACGHGAVEIARLFKDFGVNNFAVATIEEALELRQASIDSEILVFGYPETDVLDLIINYKLTPTVYSYELAWQLNHIAVKMNQIVPIHIKIDTGMSRLGFVMSESSINDIKRIFKLPNINIEGIFTHFYCADQLDKSYAYEQLEKFDYFCNRLQQENISFKYRHIANSAALFEMKNMPMDYIRIGLALYGIYQGNLDRKLFPFKQVMSLKTRVIAIREIEAGTHISYGTNTRASRKMKLATLPIGYADGYSQLFSNKAKVLVNGQFAPVVGKICMDYTIIDVSDISEIKLKDEVVLFGGQGPNFISLVELASIIGISPFEIVTRIGKRVKRFYVGN